MYFLNFSPAKVVEFSNPQVFQERTLHWLTRREGENNYLLRTIAQLVAAGANHMSRLFTVQDGDSIHAAGMHLQNGGIITSWATPEQVEAIADHVVKAKWVVTCVHGPAHVCQHLAEAIAARMGWVAEMDRGERVYQLSNVITPGVKGNLSPATGADRLLVRSWMEGFVADAQYELSGRTPQFIADTLIDENMLYLWKQPETVGMAAWVGATFKGASLNFVYTPPSLRGKGYGKAVTAGLAAHMLANGLKYCFILTEHDNEGLHRLYQSIGARTLCELVRYNLKPAASKPRFMTTGGRDLCVR